MPPATVTVPAEATRFLHSLSEYTLYSTVPVAPGAPPPVRIAWSLTAVPLGTVTFSPERPPPVSVVLV